MWACFFLFVEELLITHFCKDDYSSSDEDENQNEENDSIADILLDLDDCSNTTIHPRFNLSSDQGLFDCAANFIYFMPLGSGF